MLKDIQKNLNKFLKTNPDLSAMEEGNMEQNEILQEQLKTALETNVGLNTALENATTKLAEMAEKLGEIEAKLEATLQTEAEAVAEAHAVKMKARKEQITAAVGEDKAEALMTATETMDDASFETLVGAMTGKLEKEADTELFKELGTNAEVDKADANLSGSLLKGLQEKYSAKA